MSPHIEEYFYFLLMEITIQLEKETLRAQICFTFVRTRVEFKSNLPGSSSIGAPMEDTGALGWTERVSHTQAA